MFKTTVRYLFLFTLFITSVATNVFSQTITIGTIDPGPYAPGSTVAIPFHVDDSGGCIGKNNTYQLYMSDASGSFAASTTPVLVSAPNTFYATFLNYTLFYPASLAPGNYKFMVKATTPSPGISSGSSASVIVAAGNPVTAGITSFSTIGTGNETFGACNNPANTYTFSDGSATAAVTSTASFFNEATQTLEINNHDIKTDYNFTAAHTNYTIITKSVSGDGSVSTKAYTLINNPVNSSIGIAGNATVCISGGIAPLTYNVAITGASGIQSNYPGNLYTFTWGDGSTTILTLCEIKALAGFVTHNYTRPSCGNPIPGQNNKFEVDIDIANTFCGRVGTRTTSYAAILKTPINTIQGPANANSCTNTAVTFFNRSSPGPDPNASSPTCADNPNGRYIWLVDGQIKAGNYLLNQSFTWTFTTHGSHTVTLREQPGTGNGYCPAADTTFTICVQDPPTAAFTLPASPTCIASIPVTPTNTTNPDVVCNSTYTYRWAVDKNTYTLGGTTLNDAQPQFNFTAPDTYTLTLTVTAPGGCTSTVSHQIVVAGTPTVALSGNLSLCGRGQTLTFDNTANSPTQASFTGSSAAEGSTYLWTVTGGAYSFANGTSNTSQYAQILFNDFATYHVTVTRTNVCGTVNASQDITFQVAPTVSAGPAPPPVCQAPTAAAPVSVNLNGSITGASYISSSWSGGSGTFSAPTAAITNYTPSAADYAAGSVTLTLNVVTGLATCSIVSSSVVLTLKKLTVITSNPSKSICSGDAVNYTILANNAGSTFTWTGTLIGGSASGFTASGTGGNISDILVNNTPNVDAVIKYTITPTSANGCPGDPFDFTVTIPSVPIVSFTPPPGICSNNLTGISFTSNKPTATRYTWTANSPAGITGAHNQVAYTTNTSITDVLVNNTSAAITVTYTITPYPSTTTCAGTPVNISVDVYPAPITSNAGNNAILCGTTTYVLQGNTPARGTGKWSVVSGTGLTFADDTSPTTTVSGFNYSSSYILKWTITSPNLCTSESTITISANATTVGGTTSGTTTVCAGSNTGQIVLTGQVGSVLRWESSINNGTTWQTAAASTTGTSYTYTNLLQTTQFRALLQNGSCTVETSTVTEITVNPTSVIANAGTNQILCNTATFTLNGNDPGIFIGTWTQTAGPLITFTDIHNPKTTVTGLSGGNSYTFRWTIAGLPPCPDSFSDVVIQNKADMLASFTADKKSGCGDLTVRFTNTSNNQAGALFQWNFGDGSTSTLASPQHVFAQRTDGRDTTYYISLTVVGNCVPRPPIIDSILVRPGTPVARILPASTSGCGSFAIDVRNTSPGNNISYDFYLYDGTILIQKITKTDKTKVIFNPISTTARKAFTLYMIATGLCGNTNESTHIPIVISPSTVVAQMVLKNDLHSGCAPFNTSFVNNSFEGDTFYYTIYDANNNIVDKPVASILELPYTFTKVGTYYVTITAVSPCGLSESTKTRVDVYPVPKPLFIADVTTACKNLTVKFANNTSSDDGVTPATSLIYDWDFGDGSAHSVLFAPAHAYTTSGAYTVTLTATNTATRCSDVFIRQSYIIINAPPSPAFSAQPDSVIKIPNYTFSFIDKTKGNPTAWKWQFSDGQISAKQNPIITFADTGTYKVTLTTYNAAGCDSTITRKVRVDGVPGQLYLPNAFMPTSLSSNLRIFKAIGSGIKEWHLQVFNNYGQLMWETTKLTSKGEPVEGWDGTFKGISMPQGAYQWQASALFINGTEWKGNAYGSEKPKRVGSIHLLK